MLNLSATVNVDRWIRVIHASAMDHRISLIKLFVNISDVRHLIMITVGSIH
jgi:hypothetical protein